MIKMLTIDILIFSVGYLMGIATMSIIACKSKREAVTEAFRIGYEMRNLESNTIDVTEVLTERKGKQNERGADD